MGKKANSDDAAERTLWDEWEMRRTIPQFLAKMGSLIEAGYLTEDELFNVNPEAGRLLVVLIHIDRAILDYWTRIEKAPMAVWDHPFPKYEFYPLWRRYLRWYQKHGSEKSVLFLPDLPDAAQIQQTQLVSAAHTPLSQHPAKK